MFRPQTRKLASWPRFGGARGFSIIELMVAIAIMGIALAVAAPNFSRSLRTARAQRAQNDLASDLRLAMSTARASGRSVQLVFSANGYIIIDPGDSTVYRNRDFGTDVTFEATSDPLIFPWGQVQPANVSIGCVATQGSQNLSIAPTGRLTNNGGQQP